MPTVDQDACRIRTVGNDAVEAAQWGKEGRLYLTELGAINHELACHAPSHRGLLDGHLVEVHATRAAAAVNAGS